MLGGFCVLLGRRALGSGFRGELTRGAFKLLKKQTGTLLPLPCPLSALSLRDPEGQGAFHLASSLLSPGDKITSPPAASFVRWCTSFLLGPHWPRSCGLMPLPSLLPCVPALGILAFLSASFPLFLPGSSSDMVQMTLCGLILFAVEGPL